LHSLFAHLERFHHAILYNCEIDSSVDSSPTWSFCIPDPGHNNLKWNRKQKDFRLSSRGPRGAPPHEAVIRTKSQYNFLDDFLMIVRQPSQLIAVRRGEWSGRETDLLFSSIENGVIPLEERVAADAWNALRSDLPNVADDEIEMI
jgi:hypothetical protein